MAAIPYMPLYVADYLADAAHLSTVQHGAYMLLIMTYWQRGEPLPDNDNRLARIARMTDREWQANRDDLAEFFDIREGLWHHGRIERELEKVRSKSTQASRAGRASAQRRGSGRSADAELPFNHSDIDTDSSGSSEPETRKRATALPEDFMPVLTPTAQTIVDRWTEGVFERELEQFKDHHRAKGSTMKDWQAAFRTWITNAEKFRGERVGGRTGPGGKQSGWA